jgi:Arylsulfotransferase (ASST)
MTRVLFSVSFVLALIAGGACVGTVGEAQSTGSATGTAGANANAGTTGTAGTNATAGTTGTAGTNDAAGTTGTAGSTGPTGSAGTTGTAGRGGTTGTAGSIGGTTGTAGRGGTTGTAGSTSGAAGRGGTTGSAGTTGSGGVTGGGGMTSCTITATSTMGTIPTVGIVTFTTSATSPTAAEIRFGLASTGPTMTAPVDLTKAMYRTLLLGMKGSSSYVYRIVVTSSAGTCTSQDYTFMTGAVPSSVPKPTVTISNAAGHAKGFIVTSSGLSGTGAYIYDSDGAPVWWATGPSGVSRIQMSWDGSKMYMTALNVQNSGGSVKIVDMDGSNATTVSGLTTAHHDMTAIPGGFATLLWTTTGMDVPCSLIERSDDGTMKTIIANVNTVYNSSTFHTNSLHYYPSDNTYTLGDRNPNLYVKVSRTGQLIWQLGGSNPKDASKFFSGTGTWSVNHGHHLTADGTFYLFNNGQSGSSTIRGFKLNTSTMTATSTLTYTGITSMVLGDVQSLPNGNILITASTSGQITEITTGSQVVATFKWSALGYSEYRDSLYGPPPR